MRVHDCREFAGIEPQQFARLATELEARGLGAAGESGVIEFRGVKGTYRYDRARQALELCVMERPALLPSSVIWRALSDLASQYLGRTL